MSAHAVGYVAAIIQAVLYATMGIFAKLLYECGLSAQLVMVLRFSCTVVFLGLFILFFHGRKFISHQPAVYVQSIFFFLSAWLYFLAVERINAGLATVLFYTFPAIVAVLNVLVFHERITARVIIALALSLLGIVLISGVLAPGEAPLDPIGIIFAIAACTAFAIYSVLIQKTARTESSFTATFTISLVCLAASLVLFAGELGGLAHLGAKELALGSGLAILATILPIVLYIFAIARIGATKASIISIIETPSSLLLAWFILGETIDVFQGIGALLVVIAILSVTLKPKEK
ncbi:MAG: DMT family transporter [Coriobacteriales bacterium]